MPNSEAPGTSHNRCTKATLAHNLERKIPGCFVQSRGFIITSMALGYASQAGGSFQVYWLAESLNSATSLSSSATLASREISL